MNASQEEVKKIRQRERQARYRQKNSLKFKERSYLDKKREYDAKRRKEKGEQIKQYDRERYKKNKNEKQEYAKKYATNNRDKINLYRRNRRKSDPAFNLLCCVSAKTLKLIKNLNISKKNNTQSFIKYFGCTPELLKQHIESQFYENMGWENHGISWHLDHILPISLGQTEDQIYMLNHYTNLRPMWATQNIIKSDSLPDFIPEGFPYWQHFLHHFEAL